MDGFGMLSIGAALSHKQQGKTVVSIDDKDHELLGVELGNVTRTMNRMKDHIGSSLEEMRNATSDSYKGYLACEICRMEEVVKHLESAKRVIETIQNS